MTDRRILESTEELCMKLRHMKLSGMADELERQNNDPNHDLVSFDERLNGIINAEWNLRYNKKLNRFIKKATLRYPEADLDDAIYDPARQLDTDTIERLSKCSWIEEGRNLLVTGASGSDKSYIANALCICALRQFKTVCYSKTSTLIYELEKADLEKTHLEYISKLVKLDLVVLDDFGLMDLDPDKCRNLFELIDAREGRKSIIVISQLPVSSWYELFKDNTYADACLDRLVNRAFRLQFNGKNMRNPSL